MRWSEIDVHYRGEVVTSGGHGFSAMGRKELLGILQRRAASLGVDLRFRSEVTELDGDLVVAADGVNSTLRATLRLRARARPAPRDVRLVRHRPRVQGLHVHHRRDAAGRRAGARVPVLGLPLDVHRREHAACELDKAQCEDLFGYRLIENRTRWINFVTVRNPVWRRENVVLLGDAAHTAHFSIGSGTKLAMEDAISLAWAVREGDIDAYEAERRPIVESTQRAAQGSLEWFEGIGRYVHQDPRRFAFNLLTRSRRITFGELELRDPEFVASVAAAPPMFTPFRLRALELGNRVVVSPMDMYTSVDGTPGDFHLVHLGARALGGAGLVMTEMICTSAEGRITPGCGGLYRDEHTAAWKRIVDFVHTHSRSAIGAQLGHAGRKGSTKLMWEGDNEPLEEGNWPLIAPSPIPWDDAHQTPREMTRADLDDVRAQFVAATERAAAAGFDLLELHMAHGYLLSSRSCRRCSTCATTSTGRTARSSRSRCSRRAVPCGRRTSRCPCASARWTGPTAASTATPRSRSRAGCRRRAATSSTSRPARSCRDQQPAYGRSFQTPYADRIRNEVGLPVIAVGAISSYDDVNTIILAGRADLCALARPHLWDPHWTLHAAADQGVEMEWIPQYRSGAREPQTGKDVRRMPLRRFDQVVV